jgi:hypothetical protein
MSAKAIEEKTKGKRAESRNLSDDILASQRSVLRPEGVQREDLEKCNRSLIHGRETTLSLRLILMQARKSCTGYVVDRNDRNRSYSPYENAVYQLLPFSRDNSSKVVIRHRSCFVNTSLVLR